MALKPRNAEVEQMMTAIEGCQSLEEVARVALVEAGRIIQDRQVFIVATDARLLYGPFWTDTEAYNALAGGSVDGFVDDEGIKEIRKDKGIPTLGGKAAVLQATGPLAMAAGIDEKDRKAWLFAEKRCATCEHELIRHGENGKSEACGVPGCKCSKSKAVGL